MGSEVISDWRLPIADWRAMSTELIVSLRSPTVGCEELLLELEAKRFTPENQLFTQSEISNRKSAMFWWRRRELNSDPRVNAERLYMLSHFSFLADKQPEFRLVQSK